MIIEITLYSAMKSNHFAGALIEITFLKNYLKERHPFLYGTIITETLILEYAKRCGIQYESRVILRDLWSALPQFDCSIELEDYLKEDSNQSKLYYSKM
jgi:hypothetical protein